MEADNENVKKLTPVEEVDQLTMLETLPLEIWHIIFDFVENPSDLIRWISASPYVYSLLKDKRTTFMFPEVLNILRRNNYLTKQDCKHLVNLRGVCKGWKSAIDQLLENSSRYLYLQRFKNSRHFTSASVAYPAFVRLYKPSLLIKLETELLPAVSTELVQNNNPFPSRFLDIYETFGAIQPLGVFPNDGNDVEELIIDCAPYRLITEEICRKAGHHFWYAHIALLQLTSCPMDWYNVFTRYARGMPNLKSLYIQSPEFCHRQIYRFRNLPIFPTLNNLELLSVERALNSSVNAIMAANRHIKALFIPTTQTDLFSLRGVPSMDGQEDLNLSLLPDLHTFSASLMYQQEFNNMPTKWRLHVLRLDFSRCIDLKNWSAIFKKLECYKSTLTELYVHLPRAISPVEKLLVWESSRSWLHLFKLRKLEAFINNICSLDFLLGLVALEYLVLHFHHFEQSPPSRGTREQTINYHAGFEENFLQCNIWDVLPSLKKVDLKINYTAEQQSFQRHERTRNDMVVVVQ